MWDCKWSSNNKKQQHQPLALPFLPNQPQNHLPIQAPQQNDDADAPSPDHPLLSSFAMIFTSWLRRSTGRYLILAFCSPLLLPLFCVTFPCLCFLEVLFHLCRRRRRKRKRRSIDGCDGDRMRQSEDEADGERLLQRYLEDQLILVAGSVYECGDAEEEEDDGVDIEYFDNRSPALQ